MIWQKNGKFKNVAIFGFSGVIFIFYFSWLFYPGFQEPVRYKNMNYSQLVKLLGDPNFISPGKFVAWKANRIAGDWILEASFDAVPEGNDIPMDVSRFMLVGTSNFSVKLFEAHEESGAMSNLR